MAAARAEANNKGGNVYGAAGGGAGGRPGPYPATAQQRSVGTPHLRVVALLMTAREVPVPQWALQLWSVHNTRAALFRQVVRELGADILEPIASLPGVLQYQAVVGMLYNPSAHENPKEYLVWVAQRVGRMPSTTGDTPSATPRSSGSRWVVLQFGASLGCEWLGLQLAQAAMKQSGRDVNICERIFFETAVPWGSVVWNIL